MTQAQEIIAAAKRAAYAKQTHERICSTPEGREAARLSAGNPALEAITAALFGDDLDCDIDDAADIERDALRVSRNGDNSPT